MADDWKAQKWAKDIWYSGKVTRRRLIGYGAASAGALGATMLVPAPWRAAFGQAKPYKIGTLQPLSGAAAAGGKTALVGVQMAADRINKAGGINGRPVELIIEDYESKPDVGRRKAEKLVVEDKIDAHVGGFLSNVCLACMPVYEEAKIVNMVSVCLDTTITTSKCNRYTFRPVRLRAGPGGGDRALPGQQARQEVAHRLRRLRLGPVDPRRLHRADQEGGRRVRRHHRHPARHRRHDAVHVQDHRQLRRHLRHLVRRQRASRSATRPSTSGSPRSTSGRATAPWPS